MKLEPDPDIEPVRAPNPRVAETALSPVGETIGDDTAKPKRHAAKEQICSETALEASSNY
jgi:hypothetical protein